jgi:cullin-4
VRRRAHAQGIYAEAFEAPFLEASAAWFAADAAAALAERDVPGYLAHAEARLAEEAERCAAVLDAGTRKPLLAAAERALVAAHLPALLDKGFASLMAAGRVPDLARLYALAGRVGAHEALRSALAGYVKATGQRLVTDAAKEGEMVPALLELKARLDGVHRDAFGGAEPFGHALKDALEQVVNARANRPAELVAKFIDGALRAGNKGSSEEELEALLDRVLVLFRYISGKDVFEAFYKKDLAKRLLLGKSASIDAEKSMIAKLKAECGAQFTSKLEGMFKDVDTSRDVAAAFRAAPAARRVPQGLEVAVSVLTAGYWPTYPPAEVTLPAEVAAASDAFASFYLSKHGGRRLAWQHALGSCVLRGRFAACGARELQVSLFQAAALLLFNDAPRHTFEEARAGQRTRGACGAARGRECAAPRLQMTAPPRAR